LEKNMKESKLFHPSSRPAGHGITIGTARFYDVSAALFGGEQLSAPSSTDEPLEVERDIELFAGVEHRVGIWALPRLTPTAAGFSSAPSMLVAMLTIKA